jgi:hypothetical protein
VIGLPKQFIKDVTELSDQTIARFDVIREEVRRELIKRLAILGVATFAIPIATKNLTPNELVRFRPMIGVGSSSMIALASFGLKGLLTYRNYGQRGLEVALEIGIESVAENLVQQPAQANYTPHNSHNQQREQPIASVEEDTTPPMPVIENVAETVIHSNLPVLVIGESGSGKTTVIDRILYEGNRNYPDAENIVFDGKPTDDRRMLGIKSKPGAYYSVEQVEDVPRFSDAMEAVSRKMSDSKRSPKSRRIIVIVDELNNGIEKAEKFALLERVKPAQERDVTPYAKLMQSNNRLIISQGREKACLGIATTHDAGEDAIGTSASMRSNYGFLVLGADTGYDNIERIISGTGSRLITNPNTLAELKAQYYHWRDEIHAHKRFAILNIGGKWRLVLLPDWSQQPPDIWTGNPIADSNLAPTIDENFEDDEPTDLRRANKSISEAKITIKDTEATSIPESELKSIYAQWKNTTKSKSDFIKEEMGRPAKKYSGDRYREGLEILDRAIKLAIKREWDEDTSAQST